VKDDSRAPFGVRCHRISLLWDWARNCVELANHETSRNTLSVLQSGLLPTGHQGGLLHATQVSHLAPGHELGTAVCARWPWPGRPGRGGAVDANAFLAISTWALAFSYPPKAIQRLAVTRPAKIVNKVILHGGRQLGPYLFWTEADALPATVLSRWGPAWPAESHGCVDAAVCCAAPEA
jgi:hypothetical protein